MTFKGLRYQALLIPSCTRLQQCRLSVCMAHQDPSLLPTWEQQQGMAPFRGEPGRLARPEATAINTARAAEHALLSGFAARRTCGGRICLQARLASNVKVEGIGTFRCWQSGGMTQGCSGQECCHSVGPHPLRCATAYTYMHIYIYTYGFSGRLSERGSLDVDLQGSFIRTLRQPQRLKHTGRRKPSMPGAQATSGLNQLLLLACGRQRAEEQDLGGLSDLGATTRVVWI